MAIPVKIKGQPTTCKVHIMENTNKKVHVLNKIRGQQGTCDPSFMSNLFMAISAIFWKKAILIIYIHLKGTYYMEDK